MRIKMLLVLLLVLFCAIGQNSFAITNGQDLAEENSQQVVKLSLPEGTCTGIVVGPSTVLTAKHCTGDQNPRELLINGVPSTLIRLPDPTNEEETDLDLALVKLSQTVPTWALVRRSLVPEVSVGVSIVGYGGSYLLDGKTIDWSDRKRIGQNVLQVGSKYRNQSYYNIYFEIGPYNSNLPSGALPGDSGGPMFYEGTVIGVSSKSSFGISNYTSLQTARSIRFLDEDTREGWDIRWTD